MSAMDNANTLGEYLRARRGRVRPEEVDLPPGGRRRVPGLRREEVASLAGLSVDYYTRLEQGREQHPSASVLNALAGTLRLGPDAQRYLFAIATPGPRAAAPRRRPIGENLLALVDEWRDHPTVLYDSLNHIVAANHLGRALFSMVGVGGNTLRFLFLDERAREFHREWEHSTASMVAAVRATAAHAPDDPALMALIGELTVRSPRFARLWARADVREKTTDVLQVRHELVGDLDLVYETFRPTSAPELVLKVHRALPGSESADKLAVLGSLTAGTGEVAATADAEGFGDAERGRWVRPTGEAASDRTRGRPR